MLAKAREIVEEAVAREEVVAQEEAAVREEAAVVRDNYCFKLVCWMTESHTLCLNCFSGGNGGGGNGGGGNGGGGNGGGGTFCRLLHKDMNSNTDYARMPILVLQEMEMETTVVRRIKVESLC